MSIKSQQESRVYFLLDEESDQYPPPTVAIGCSSSYIGYSDYHTEKGVRDWFHKGKRHHHSYVVGKSTHWSQEEISSYGVIPENLFSRFIMTENKPSIELTDGSLLRDFTEDKVWLWQPYTGHCRYSVHSLMEKGILNKLDYDDCEQAGIETAKGFDRHEATGLIHNKNEKNSKSYRVGVSPFIASFAFNTLINSGFHWEEDEEKIYAMKEIVLNHIDAFGERFLPRDSWMFCFSKFPRPNGSWVNKKDILTLQMCQEIRDMSATQKINFFDIEEMSTLASTLKTLGNFGDSMIKRGLAKKA